MTRRELRRRAEALRAPQAVAESSPPVLRVLMVCTGNICRSPMAEALLRARMDTDRMRVRSAGTRPVIDGEMPAEAQRLTIAHGGSQADARGHRGRWLIEPIAEDADLIFAMAREHRTAAVELAPRMLRRTFTVREFARLATSLSDSELREAAESAGSDVRARLTAVTALIATQRSMVTPPSPKDDDVIDPYRRSSDTYERSAAQLVPAIDEVARVLRIVTG